MKRMKRFIFRGKFHDLSLKYKISLMTLVVAAVPVFLFGIVLTLNFSQAVEQRSRKHIEENIGFMSRQIGQVFSEGTLCTNYLTLTFNNIVNDMQMRQVDKDKAVKSALNRTILIFDGIDSILFLDGEERLYTTNVGYSRKREKIMESYYMKRLRQVENGKTLLFDMRDDCMVLDSSRPVVTMGKKVVNITTGETMGYLFLNVDINKLEQSIRNQISIYFLLDRWNNCVAGTKNKELLMSLIRQCGGREKLTGGAVRYNGSRYLVVEKRLEDSGWSVIGVTNLNEYNVGPKELAKTFLISGTIVVLLLFVLSIILSNILTKPLVTLKAGAEEISRGNLDVRFRMKSGDEIGRLGDIFNDMTGEIKGLVKKAEEAGKQKREYELALVQQQVKPHFLYNSLDIIIILIDMDKPREAKRVTGKLADYYRNSLSSSEEIISLDKELRIVEDYLELQMVRYRDKFVYEIDAEDAEGSFLLPKMTLQPLVENALYHGLKNKAGPGTISIQAYTENGRIVLRVFDDGIGMDKKTLEEIQLLKDKPKDHFGVYSVNHRLQLYYGEEYRMQVDSRLGEGTEIRLYLPEESLL